MTPTPTPFDDTPLPLAYWQQRLQISRTSLWRWTRRGLKTETVAGRTFIRPTAVSEFIAAQSASAEEGRQ